MGSSYKSRIRVRKSFISFLLVFVWLQVGQAPVLAAPKAKQIDFWNDSEEESGLKIDYSAWDSLLKKFVITDHPSRLNRFDYESVSEGDKLALDGFVDYIQKMDPRQLTKQRQKAYWLNLFNAGLIQQVLKSEPEDSIKDISGNLWKRKRFYIAMQKMSLDDVEHGVLRPIFKDPRIHFSLVAGTVGSANILPVAFTGDNVEQLIEENTKEFLSHSRGVRNDNGKLVLSRIFNWYQADFGGNFEGVKSFIKPYAPQSLAPILIDARKAKYQYDWSLNKP